MTMTIFELVVAAAEIEHGRSPSHVAARGVVHMNNISVSPIQSRKTSSWTAEEDQFLRQNHGYMTESEIGSFLGRTAVAVHLRWKRELHLPAPSRHPDVYTANQAADLIGIDSHKVIHYCDAGLIPHRTWGVRNMRIIRRMVFRMWVVNPNNWIYFDWRKIPDAHLRRLCELRSIRWGDEWLNTVQVAQMHGVDTKDVQRLAYRGDLPAVQVATSLGGRHKDPAWLNWFVKRSDAERVVFHKGRGVSRPVQFSPRANEWIRKAHAAGWSYSAINRSMGEPVTSWTLSKYITRMMAHDGIYILDAQRENR